MVGPGSPDNQPLKLAGYGLLAVAAIAAIVGLITLAAGGSEAAQPDPAIAAPPSSEIAPPPPAEPSPAAPAPAGPVPAPAAPAPAPGAPAPAPNQLATPNTSSSAPALPGAGLPASGPSEGSTTGSSGSRSRSVAKAPVRIYNNSTITGLAERAADDLRDSGWSVTEVGNWPHSTIPTSTVYYRSGTSEQAAARNLASSFGMRAEPRFAGIQDASPGLIVIVTKDFQRR